MDKVIIIGGGFAGLSCAIRLAKAKGRVEITLVDKKATLDFLPLLPDTIGRGILPESLSYRIDAVSRKAGFSFLNEEVERLDLEKRSVLTATQSLPYDYAVIAAGSETNFYGNGNIQQNVYKVDSVQDVEVIRAALRKQRFDHYIIAGGGYTGIEVATNIRLFLTRRKSSGRVVIIERAPSILGPLPAWMKEYVSQNLKELGIEVFTNSAIEKIEGQNVRSAAGQEFKNALVIWAAGVKTPAFIQNLTLEKNPQGRVKVDVYLKAAERLFVAGDAAYMHYKDIFLRMAVQFAIAQGECVAENVMLSMQGRPLWVYMPNDLGYIIPMANNRSCGNVMGKDLKGRMPTAMHFLMCIYRSYGFKNRWGIVKGLLKGGGA